MKIAELVADVVFNFDSLKLKELVGMVGALNISSLASVGALAELAGKVQEVIKSTDEFSQSLVDIHKATGIPEEYIERFGKLAERYGSTNEEAQNFLTTLNELQLKIAQGKADQTPFTLLKISNFQDTEEVIKKVSQALNNPSLLKDWASFFAPTAHKPNEMLAAFEADILKQMGAGPHLRRTLEQVTRGNEFQEIPTTAPETVERALRAHRDWVAAAQDLNTQLRDTVSQVTEIGTKILEWVDKTHFITNSFRRVKEEFSLLLTGGNSLYTPQQRAFLDKGGQVLSGGLEKLFAPVISGVSGNSGNSTKNQTNNFNMTVYAQDVTDFEHKANTWLTKKLIDADSQVGQSK